MSSLKVAVVNDLGDCTAVLAARGRPGAEQIRAGLAPACVTSSAWSTRCTSGCGGSSGGSGASRPGACRGTCGGSAGRSGPSGRTPRGRRCCAPTWRTARTSRRAGTSRRNPSRSGTSGSHGTSPTYPTWSNSDKTKIQQPGNGTTGGLCHHMEPCSGYHWMAERPCDLGPFPIAPLLPRRSRHGG